MGLWNSDKNIFPNSPHWEKCYRYDKFAVKTFFENLSNWLNAPTTGSFKVAVKIPDICLTSPHFVITNDKLIIIFCGQIC